MFKRFTGVEYGNFISCDTILSIYIGVLMSIMFVPRW